MCVCVCVCVCGCVCVCMFMCARMFVSECVCGMCAHASMHTDVYVFCFCFSRVCMHACVCACMRMCVHTHTCMYMHVHASACVHMQCRSCFSASCDLNCLSSLLLLFFIDGGSTGILKLYVQCAKLYFVCYNFTLHIHFIIIIITTDDPNKRN